jgi:hypothetical protein
VTDLRARSLNADEEQPAMNRSIPIPGVSVPGVSVPGETLQNGSSSVPGGRT